jgi:arylformamidase
MDKRRFIDISMSIENGMISWPSDGPVKIDRIRSMENGERVNLSRINMSAHTGTHIDAPVHFLEDGKGIDQISLGLFFGPAVLIHIPGVRQIGARQLELAGAGEGTERLLIKTDNSRLLEKQEFDKRYSHISMEGAKYLVEHGIRLVGIDYLSVAEYGKGDAVHRELLGAGITIIEGLDLRGVEPGSYHLTALPLRIRDCDGAPARVILEERKEEG